uniref:Endonuclease-reverse transcriptase n=1 Tax=Cacopsylla melanoneura TaxID=428564 RepID=A0A8D8LLB2_9HEMI
MEAWTLKKADILKLEAFEMWCYRRILNISWVEKISNLEVLRRMNKNLEVVKTIKSRKLKYFGHMMRGEKYEILHRILQGKICGKKGRGRPRIDWLQNLKEWFQYNTKQIFNAAKNKHHIAMMISDLR